MMAGRKISYYFISGPGLREYKVLKWKPFDEGLQKCKIRFAVYCVKT